MIDPTADGGVVPPAGEVARSTVEPLPGVSPTTAAWFRALAHTSLSRSRPAGVVYVAAPTADHVVGVVEAATAAANRAVARRGRIDSGASGAVTSAGGASDAGGATSATAPAGGTPRETHPPVASPAPVGVRLLTTPAVWDDVADRTVGSGPGGREIEDHAAALAARQWLAVRVDDSGGWAADDLLAAAGGRDGADDTAADTDPTGGRNVPQSGSEPEPKGKLAGDARHPEAGAVVAGVVGAGEVAHVRGDDSGATLAGAGWRRAVTEWAASAPVTLSLAS